ncbi:MAG: hypothetical protein NVSMB19_26430 [Vulcanimicrobiaceae bacterium]
MTLLIDAIGKRFLAALRQTDESLYGPIDGDLLEGAYEAVAEYARQRALATEKKEA